MSMSAWKIVLRGCWMKNQIFTKKKGNEKYEALTSGKKMSKKGMNHSTVGGIVIIMECKYKSQLNL